MPSIQFKGKTHVANHHLSVPYHELIPQPDKSITDTVSLHDNLIIKGDNLLALKALLPTYGGRVKCIYIDPPYNTGNEKWVYNDNVNSPMIKEWLKKEVDKEDMTRHDKWLCMMMPRLRLLHELLAEDGAIFISIDDSEQHRLRMLCDEVFGEENFFGHIIWEKSDSPKMDATGFSIRHDHILCYAKSKTIFSLIKEETGSDMPDHYNKVDDEGKPFYLKPLRVMGGNESDSLFFGLPAPDGETIFPIKEDGSNGNWRWSPKKVNLEKHRIQWVKGKMGWVPYFRIYYNEEAVKPIHTIWKHSEVGSNRTSKIELKAIMQGDYFNTPKPLGLIRTIIDISTDSDSIILDSFAGSGTTAHAVLALNKADGGNRQFILVEQEDYADTLTAERVRRVINGVPSSKHFAEGTGGSFSYFELGAKPIETFNILNGQSLPTWEEMARYVFYTATGEVLKTEQCQPERHFVGTSRLYDVYLHYQPDLQWLRQNAFTLENLQAMPRFQLGQKERLVFAPCKFVDDDMLHHAAVRFCQLPYEIYQLS